MPAVEKATAMSQFWRDEDDVALVYISASSWNEGSANPRAGYAVSFGKDATKCFGGRAKGSQTEIRAYLAGIVAAMEKAKSFEMKKLAIRHKCPALTALLELWAATGDSAESKFKDVDILKKIDRIDIDMCNLTSGRSLWIEEAEPPEYDRLKEPQLKAKRVAGIHSTAPHPVNNTMWINGSRVVHILGTSTRESTPRAGYGVYWGLEDFRNEAGGVTGRQDHRRAQIAAVWAAMRSALMSDMDELIICSKSFELGRIMERLDVPFETLTNGDLIRNIQDIRPKFTLLKHVLVEDCPEQGRAKFMARTFRRCKTASVVVGVLTDRNGSRYGIFFGEDDNDRNESAHVPGSQGEVHAVLLAIQRAMEIAATAGIRHLTIRTSSSHADRFFSNTIHIHSKTFWTEFRWPAIGKTIADLATKINITVAPCTAHEEHMATALCQRRL